MKRLLACALLVSAALRAQAPVVGDINFYGLRTVTPERILSALHLRSGDLLPPSKGDMEDRITEIPNVVLARVEAICCEGKATTLFIGIEEKGAPHPAFRSPPAGDATIPEDLMDTYQQYLTAVQRAAARGTTSEDLSAGHALMADPEVRALQEHFLLYAGAHLDELRNAIHNSSEGAQRAAAVAILGYAPDKRKIIDDLQFALQDPDESVRANALGTLNAVAVLASKQPQLGLRIAPTWMIELLHSVVLSDRVESVKVLLTLTDSDARAVLDEIRDRAAGDVIEMAEWKTPRYALPPFLLAGRVAGLSDAQTQEDWRKGDRAAVTRKLQAAPRKRIQ